VKGTRLGIVAVIVYLLAVAAAASYEIDIRVHDTAHSEFAGWMSAMLTLPTILVVNFLSRELFGVRMGDSNAAFIGMVACAALVNACAIYLVARKLR